MQYFQCTYTIQYLLPQLHNCTHLRKKVVNCFLLKKLDLMKFTLTYFFEFTFKAEKVAFTIHSKSNHDLTVKLFIGPCAIRTEEYTYICKCNNVPYHKSSNEIQKCKYLGNRIQKTIIPLQRMLAVIQLEKK